MIIYSSQLIKEVVDMRIYDYTIRLFDNDGSFLHKEKYTVTLPETSDPECDAGEGNMLAYNQAEQLMIDHDANDYTVEKTDAG